MKKYFFILHWGGGIGHGRMESSILNFRVHMKKFYCWIETNKVNFYWISVNGLEGGIECDISEY